MPDPFALLLPLLERSHTVYFVYDLLQKRVLYVSPAYALLTGNPVALVNETLPGWLDQVHPDDRRYVRQRLAQVPTGERVQDVELRVGQPGGERQWLRLTLCQVVGPDGRAYLSGHATDITQAKEHSLSAEKFNTKKNATLEILSHDLAAPLVLVQQLADHLKGELPAAVPTPVPELLALMERTCQEGVALIRDFVDHEFLESANVQMQWERADLGAWLRTILEEYERSERHTRLRFALQVPAEPVYVYLDVNKFQQVVNNLISNALKFTPDGGAITVHLDQLGARAVVRVADTGVGIPTHLLPGLFDKFTKARRPGLRGEKTTGLGMSVIRTIVGLHHGQVRVESIEAEGTTVWVELPTTAAGLA